jgi:hypothetical protein
MNLRTVPLQQIKTDILRASKAKERETENLSNLQSLNLPYALQQETKVRMQKNISDYERQIDSLYEKESDILAGKYDEEYLETQNTQKREYETKQKNNLKKYEEIKRENESKKKRYESRVREPDERSKQRDYAYFYKQYTNAVENVPSYITKNLAKMPNNKGYIWKGCWFLGFLPAERNEPTMLFEKRYEKKKGESTYIHEYTPTEYRLYAKAGKGPKVLVQAKKRLAKMRMRR